MTTNGVGDSVATGISDGCVVSTGAADGAALGIGVFKGNDVGKADGDSDCTTTG